LVLLRQPIPGGFRPTSTPSRSSTTSAAAIRATASGRPPRRSTISSPSSGCCRRCHTRPMRCRSPA